MTPCKRILLTFCIAFVTYLGITTVLVSDKYTFNKKWNAIHIFPKSILRSFASAIINENPINEEAPVFLPRVCNNSYSESCGMSAIFRDFRSALEQQASPEKVVILAGLVDGAYVDFAVNLHVTSIAPYDICNVLYIAIDETTLNKTQQYNMPVLYYKTNITNKAVGGFRSEAFREKSKIKLDVTLMALQMGYTVLLMDLDIFFRSNPMPAIECGEDCDFAIQDNSNRRGKNKELNTGFILLKSNQRTIQLYQEFVNRAKSYSGNDQGLINEIIYSKQIPELKMVVFPPDKFCVGRKKNGVQGCTVFHANWVIGLKGKQAMLRKWKMWEFGSPKSKLHQCKMLGNGES